MKILDSVTIEADGYHVRVTYTLGPDSAELGRWADCKFVTRVPFPDGSYKQFGIAWVDDEPPTGWVWHGDRQATAAVAVVREASKVTARYSDASISGLDKGVSAFVTAGDGVLNAVDLQSDVPVTML